MALNFALRWATDRLRPAVTMLPPDPYSRERFESILLELDNKSSPGHPWMYTYATVGDFLFKEPGVFKKQNVEALWQDVQSYILGRRSAHPVRIFVKGEPVKLAKAAEGRFRLISAVSLSDAVLDHMLFDSQNKREVELFHLIPCMPGWSTAYGGWKCIDSQAVGFDRTAWDHTVPGWLLMAEKRLRKALCVNPPQSWLDLVDRRYDDLFKSAVLQLTSGFKFRQNFPGHLKSGAVNTISTNSHMQLILHAYACKMTGADHRGYYVAMGDDTLQDPDSATPEYEKFLSTLVKLKPPTVGEFCSFKFRPGGSIEPLNWAKHLNTLAYCTADNLKATLLSFQVIYARSVRLQRLREIVYEVCPSAYLSDLDLDEIMNW